MRFRVVPLIALVVLAGASPVRAYDGESETPVPVTSAAPEPEKRWYGAPAAVVDAAAAVLIVGNGFFLGGAGKSLGVSAGLLVAPIVHLTHHHPGRAAASFAMRGAAFLLTIVAGDFADGRCGDDTVCIAQSKVSPWTVAAIFGGVALLDDALLAREYVQPGVVVSLRPRLQSGREALSFSIGGRF